MTPTHEAWIGGSPFRFHLDTPNGVFRVLGNPPPCADCADLAYTIKRSGEGWSLDCRLCARSYPLLPVGALWL